MIIRIEFLPVHFRATNVSWRKESTSWNVSKQEKHAYTHCAKSPVGFLQANLVCNEFILEVSISLLCQHESFLLLTATLFTGEFSSDIACMWPRQAGSDFVTEQKLCVDVYVFQCDTPTLLIAMVHKSLPLFGCLKCRWICSIRLLRPGFFSFTQPATCYSRSMSVLDWRSRCYSGWTACKQISWEQGQNVQKRARKKCYLSDSSRN